MKGPRGTVYVFAISFAASVGGFLETKRRTLEQIAGSWKGQEAPSQ